MDSLSTMDSLIRSNRGDGTFYYYEMAPPAARGELTSHVTSRHGGGEDEQGSTGISRSVSRSMNNVDVGDGISMFFLLASNGTDGRTAGGNNYTSAVTRTTGVRLVFIILFLVALHAVVVCIRTAEEKE